MIKATICTIGDEILIGQIVDTNSTEIAKALGNIGVVVCKIISIGDNEEQIVESLHNELITNDIVIVTGGLGPTKDDITKAALARLSHSTGYVKNENQLKIIHEILSSRGLDILPSNKEQAVVPNNCEVIPNKIGTAPIMVFRIPVDKENKTTTLYSMPGVPFETKAALPDVMNDIKNHYNVGYISHHNIMTYGLAESALSEKIKGWENALPDCVHLAYLPNMLTGVRLRLSIYEKSKEEAELISQQEISKLKEILGDTIYSFEDDNLSATIGRLLKQNSTTISAAESCTGGEISHLITLTSGASEYYLGSVTSYAIPVKEKVLGVSPEVINKYGVVSSQVAAAMAEGVMNLTGSDFAVSTTGLAGAEGDGINPGGTVWIGVSSKNRTKTYKFFYHSDREHNIEKFASSALYFLLNFIKEELN